jgi:hypothetical protein
MGACAIGVLDGVLDLAELQQTRGLLGGYMIDSLSDYGFGRHGDADIDLLAPSGVALANSLRSPRSPSVTLSKVLPASQTTFSNRELTVGLRLQCVGSHACRDLNSH